MTRTSVPARWLLIYNGRRFFMNPPEVLLSEAMNERKGEDPMIAKKTYTDRNANSACMMK